MTSHNESNTRSVVKASSAYTGLSGNTVWVTQGLYDRLRGRAAERPERRHRGADPRLGEETAQLVRGYIEHMASVSPPDRECCVATLLRYPGVQVSARRGPDGKRVGEVLLPRSRRLALRPSLRHLLAEAAKYALVLDHHVVGTRPDGVAGHPRDRGPQAPPSRARPLTDVFLTAEILQHGRLSDGPLGRIKAQIVGQATAQSLWNLAVADVIGKSQPANSSTPLSMKQERAARDVLSDALPTLLDVDPMELSSREQIIRNWDRPVAKLLSAVSNPAR
jgi:hypothetical protein